MADDHRPKPFPFAKCVCCLAFAYWFSKALNIVFCFSSSLSAASFPSPSSTCNLFAPISFWNLEVCFPSPTDKFAQIFCCSVTFPASASLFLFPHRSFLFAWASKNLDCSAGRARYSGTAMPVSFDFSWTSRSSDALLFLSRDPDLLLRLLSLDRLLLLFLSLLLFRSREDPRFLSRSERSRRFSLDRLLFLSLERDLLREDLLLLDFSRSTVFSKIRKYCNK